MIRIGITVGDPAGIGPEIILKALTSSTPAAAARSWEPVLYGSRRVFDTTAASLGLSPYGGRVEDVLSAEHDEVTPGVGSPYGARLQHTALTAAIDDALAGRIDAVVTAPWTKALLASAGLPATGHTEVLAARCGVDRPTMMLAGDQLRVALVTTHLPLREVPERLDGAEILAHLRTVDAELRLGFGIAAPRIAVCGLNPHAGEGGLMGTEDDAVIAPAIRQARAEGIDASGPHPADTLFARVVRLGTHDAVLAMYHDQGLVPLKLHHFGASANLTLGLPIVRTSVDHGTAYDIAGKGSADASSLRYAIDMALRLVENRRRGAVAASTRGVEGT